MRWRGGQRSTCAIVDAHARQPGIRRIDEHRGKSGVDETLAFVADQRQGDDDQAVEDRTSWKFHQFCPCLRMVTRCCATPPRSRAAPAGRRCRGSAGTPTSRRRTAPAHRPDDRLFPVQPADFRGRLIAELLGRACDLDTSGVADLGAAAQHARHGADAHTCMLGNIRHCGACGNRSRSFHRWSPDDASARRSARRATAPRCRHRR